MIEMNIRDRSTETKTTGITREESKTFLLAVETSVSRIINDQDDGK